MDQQMPPPLHAKHAARWTTVSIPSRAESHTVFGSIGPRLITRTWLSKAPCSGVVRTEPVTGHPFSTIFFANGSPDKTGSTGHKNIGRCEFLNSCNGSPNHQFMSFRENLERGATDYLFAFATF